MKTKSLTFIAGLIWLIAGFNVCRIGVTTWMNLEATSALMVIGSVMTMLLFSAMFVRMLFKNVDKTNVNAEPAPAETETKKEGK